MPKQLYIETVGCQMNMLDSELVVASLRREGYELVDSPQNADTVLFNTCSVRAHAEDKIYSALGRLKHAKTHNPHKLIGVIGCMAQNHQKQIFERAPFVDLIVGPGQIHQIPDLLRDVATDGLISASPEGRGRGMFGQSLLLAGRHAGELPSSVPSLALRPARHLCAGAGAAE